MTTFAPLLRVDLLLHWRRGVLAAGLGMAVVYVVLLRLVSDDVAAALLPLLVWSDPAAFGFFFVGGTLLVDRAEGTTAAVAVTPAAAAESLWARVASLAGIGVVGAILIGVGAGIGLRWGLFVPAVVATAAVYALFGFGVAMRSGSVNGYFARATLLAIPLFAPVPLAFVSDSPWLAAWPTTASLVLLQGSVPPEPAPAGWVAAVAFGSLAASAAVGARWAHRELMAARREGRA